MMPVMQKATSAGPGTRSVICTRRFLLVTGPLLGQGSGVGTGDKPWTEPGGGGYRPSPTTHLVLPCEMS